MPLCPNCKTEYQTGTALCSSCGAGLKDLPAEPGEDSEEWSAKIQEARNYLADHEKAPAASSSYIKKEERQQELLSSSHALLLVGSVGLIFLLLTILGIIHIPFFSNMNYFTYAILCTLLCLFMIYGILGLKGAKKAGLEAQEENKLVKEILEWFRKNIDTFVIEKDITKEMKQEEKYLIITDNIKTIILTSYSDVPEGLAEILSETLYAELYE